MQYIATMHLNILIILYKKYNYYNKEDAGTHLKNLVMKQIKPSGTFGQSPKKTYFLKHVFPPGNRSLTRH